MQTAEDIAKLPIASYVNAITSALEAHQVVLISGETGCGKTTQVPQYILDHMWSKAETCKVVCTQPRRISAISVAERISYERGEAVGETVGYKIRFESKGGKNSSIMFCTNGILLRLLIGRGANASEMAKKKGSKKDTLLEITHIIVDEIHERERFCDVLLVILRDLLPAYPHLRLILMSATIDVERFSQYFSGCPVIQVPGFTYPVKTYFLEDVLSILRLTDENHLFTAALSSVEEVVPLTEEYKTALDESINLALFNDELEPLLEIIRTQQNPQVFSYQHSLTGVSPLMVLSGKGRVGDVCMMLSFGADCSLTNNEGKSAMDCARQENQLQICEIIERHMEKDVSKSAEEEDLLNNYLASINPENIDTVLIERLLKRICTDSSEGAILVFLAGWADINQTRERLLASGLFKDSSKFMILSLHSMIPIVEQKKVFKHPPQGVRKIILSTNIAETAITIDDVVYVIDSGRMKEKSYDPYSNVSTFHASWISKASAKQREGRAGRCQPGICYHLYSKVRAAALPDYQVPEIKRMPVEELCLQVKLLNPNYSLIEFLQKTLDPPVIETIRNAVIVLQDIGALTEDEQLTELGEKLGALPVHPSTSKMLLFAILMNCLDPALTLACATDYREPFLLPMDPDEKKKAGAAKVELASLYGGYSDQLAVVAAFECWKNAKHSGEESQFCSRYFVSLSTMNMLQNMRKQLQNELMKAGFIPEDMSGCSLNAQDPGILRAVLVAGTYPMVARFLTQKKNNKSAIVETASGFKVFLHPHSSNFKLSFAKSAVSPIIVYDEITRGDGGLFIKNSSVVSPYSLLLLAVEMAVAPARETYGDGEKDSDTSSGEEEDMDVKASSEQHKNQLMSSPDNAVTIVIDRWLKFSWTALDVAQIYCLRERLAEAVLFKVKKPRAILPPALGASMHAIACILSYDGHPHILALDESIDPQEAMWEPTDLNIQSRERKVGAVTPSRYLKSLFSNYGRQTSVNFNRLHVSASPLMSMPASTSSAPKVPLPRITSAKARDHGSHPIPKKKLFKRRRGKLGGAPR
ncbi:DExH-box ATP-dependent RNA helicase DExH6-like isoform X2 [Phalaenopsis equestris]|uniref:DExH-box ATP-dependent RNA helicase DExH6-like isoform X2 n=1 Tax=Phalaenopsis equestris TaxID=78828 RepID=UPI0009E598EB|nr:DExH-box ATP-dependent RNA helicase DExH6-like isoform X2 [Phalaenopsis equestris]